VPAAALDPRRGTARGARALVLSIVAVLVAGAAHTLADGCLDVAGLVLALGACWPGAVALLGRRRSLPALLAWALGAQVVTHVLVSLTCGGTVEGLTPRALAGHALAVLVTSALLARQDALLWAADALRRAFLRLLLPLLVVVPVRARPRALRSVRRLRPRWLVSPRVLRGPPSGLVPSTS
jgi:hypothetical protein